MFVRSSRLNQFFSVVFVLVMGACGDFGGCGACGSTTPLPPETAVTLKGLPRDQTVEGGAQIRVTPQGFQKLTAILPGVLNQQLSSGFCVPRGEVGNCSGGFLGTGACYCTNNNGAGCNPACKVNVSLNPGGFQLSVPDPQHINIRISTTVSTTVGINGQVLGIGFSCNLGVSSNNLNGDFDIALGIKPADGELQITLDRINQFQLGLDFSGCGPLSDIGNFVSTVIDSFLGQFLIQLLTPAINDIIQGFLPNPLGVAGMMDIGKMLEDISPGTDGFMEARIVPGGYVNLIGNGMSLGVITGVNADEDPTTRTAGLTSEPHLCAPPFTPPNFGAPPANLPLTARSTYGLAAAGAFSGQPDPASTDLAMGISESTLDQLGHHLVTSGGMCLGIGTSYINQLNVGTIGLLVPSLSELQSDRGNDPLLLVTRPQRPLDFTIGDNTEASPALTIGVDNLEVDFYAFLYERYVRAFTLDLSMDIGVNLEFEQMSGQPAKIKPSLVGISSDKVTLKVLNSQFVAESRDKLEMVLPSVFDLVTPLLGTLPEIDVPTFAGFSLNNLSIQRITTTQDEFLGLHASLGTSMMMQALAQQDQFAREAVAFIDHDLVPAGAQSQGRAKLLRVVTPPAEVVRSALTKEPGGALPEVVFDVDHVDSRGRQLEWSYRLNGGMWRPYRAASPLVISDRAFAWQGKYTVGLKSRVKGDYRTVSEEIETPVIIDSVGPRVLVTKAEWNDDGDVYLVPLWDTVSGKLVSYAFGKPGADEPATAWTKGDTARISRGDAKRLLVDGELVVFAQDEVGNMSVALAAPFHGQPGEGGCECSTSGAPSTGALIVFGLVGIGLLAPRRRRPRIVLGARARRALRTIGLWVGMSLLASVVPACSCGNQERACETVADCVGFCGEGELPYCIEGECVCSDDILLNKVGPYSDVAVGGDGAIWVSAYAQYYGDLVVAKVEPGRVPDEAWEWVDGVPDGPVVFEGSKYRGGIDEKGEDVGMYTSIAVAPDGTPMVTYFDRDKASLKFAMKRGDVWEKHVIEEGTGELGEFTGELVGMYTSISLRTDDGRPAVAYLAHVADSTSRRAEVRYAASQTAFPTSAGDWQTWVVDTAPLPADDPNNPDVYPLPGGLGLFVDATRLRDQAPVVVYYDRGSGDLKLAKFDPMTGQFRMPLVLDGSGDIDAGWSPSVAVDSNDVVHVAYVSATGDDLKYITDAAGAMPEIVDDGYRIVGTTVDGLPKPEFHFVGEDASLVLANNGATPMIAYQDATTQELLLASKNTDGTWPRNSIAGAKDPWPGAYGFFAADALSGTDLVISTWVIDQPAGENWVEVFKLPTAVQ